MDGGEALGYRRLASPLHAARAWVAALWAAAFVLAALLLSQPLVLGTLALAILAAAAGAAVGRRVAGRLHTVAAVSLPIVLINVLVSRQGLTVFARLGDLGPFGQGDLTVEALAYGGWIALKVAILILLTTLASLTIDPDELLRIFRRLSFRSALTASLALRMVPLLGADAKRLAEAQRTRPDSPTGVRARALLLGAVAASSLDRAMDVAATLEVRGFAAAERRETPTTPRRAADLPTRFSRHDYAFLGSALAILCLAVAAKLSDFDQFSAYPLIHSPVSAGTLALCVALAAAVLLPFCDRRGVEL
jgi:energy-coupling factor transport system permease protein